MKEYVIAGVVYLAKEKYTLKIWAQILKILQSESAEDTNSTVINLLGGDKLNEILGLILDKPVEGDLYEDDFPVIGEVLEDFFSRKKSLMSASTNHL